jgi:hypothetical protein
MPAEWDASSEPVGPCVIANLTLAPGRETERVTLTGVADDRRAGGHALRLTFTVPRTEKTWHVLADGTPQLVH